MNRIVLFKIFIISILLTINCYSQTLTLEEKNMIIASLDSNSSEIRYKAINQIIDLKIVEATPKVEQVIWVQEKDLQYCFIEALTVLNSSRAKEYINAYIDSVDNYNLLRPSLVNKVRALKFLFQLHDFSKAKFIFDLLDNGRNNINQLCSINLLPDVINNVPEYASRAKTELETIALSADDYLLRSSAVFYLEEIYGELSLPILTKVFKEDNTESNRSFILSQYLIKYKNSTLKTLLKERLLSDPSPFVRQRIAEKLLDSYGSPNDYAFVANFNKQNIDTDSKEYLDLMIRDFRPNRPDSTFPIDKMIDSLSSILNNVKQLYWIGDDSFINILNSKLTNAKVNIMNKDSLLTSNNIYDFRNLVNSVYQDSLNPDLKFVKREAWVFLYYYSDYILNRLPSNPLFTIKLYDSKGNLLNNGKLQYYENGWKDANDDKNGTFSINTALKKVTLRMAFAFGSQTATDIIPGNDPYIFHTVNTQVKLQDSNGNPIDTGFVKYYSNGWYDFGKTTNGVAEKELLPVSYTFRMTYAYGSIDKVQKIDSSRVVLYQTANTQVKLLNSNGNPIDTGFVKYYSNGWWDFGKTINGIASKELLPINYTFRMTYACGNIDKVQKIDSNRVVLYQTANTQVKLLNSNGNPIDTGFVKYYSNGWYDFGKTINGVASKELLPVSYTFRMTYAYGSIDKVQKIDSSRVVLYQTTNTQVKLMNSNGNPIDTGFVKYYSNGWYDFGKTTNGVAEKELLPVSYTFRMTYASGSIDKVQKIDSSRVVIYQTANTQVKLLDSNGNPLDTGYVKYYSNGWRDFGKTINGVAEKELLPVNYTFRMTYGNINSEKNIDISKNSTINYSTISCRAVVKDQLNQQVNNAVITYYANGWLPFGTTVNGEANREMLAGNIPFRAKYGAVQADKTQNTLSNSVIEFLLNINR